MSADTTTLSLDLIALLMEALPQAPLLLLCVYRPEREHRCWQLSTLASRKCPDRYTELPLRELPADVARPIQAVTFTPPPAFGPTEFH